MPEPQSGAGGSSRLGVLVIIFALLLNVLIYFNLDTLGSLGWTLFGIVIGLTVIMLFAPEPKFRRFDILFLFALLIHLADVFFGRLSSPIGASPDIVLLALYIFLAWLAHGAFLKEAPAKSIFFVTVLAWFAPRLAELATLTFPAVVSPYIATAVWIFVPFWIYYLALYYNDKLGGFFQFFWWVYLLGWMLFLTVPYVQNSAALGTSDFHALAMPGTVAKTTMASAGEFFAKLYSTTITRFREEQNKTQQLAYGDYYTGQVDRNAKEKLGVYLENVQLAQPEFHEDEPVTVYGTLKAQTLDEVLDVVMNCTGKKADGAVVPDENRALFPREKFSVDVYEDVDVDCTFQKGALGTGSPTITLTADFNFKTLSYLKTYFMDQDKLRALRRTKVDPFSQYGITDTAPATIYTSGPVEIGMGTSQPPIGVNSADDKLSLGLGITVKNLWGGELKKITKFAVILPKGFSIEDVDGGAVQYQQSDCRALGEKLGGCDERLVNIYILNPPEKSIAQNGFKTYRLRLAVERPDYAFVLGTAPIATRAFKATLEYNYELKKAVTIPIKAQEKEAAVEDKTPPKLVGEPAVAVSGTTAALEWRTSEPTVDTITYYPENSFKDRLSVTPIQTPVDAHQLQLTNLLQHTNYKYQINSVDKSGNRATFTERQFTT